MLYGNIVEGHLLSGNAIANLPTFTLVNETGSTIGAHGKSWGVIFQQGAVPSGQTVVATINGSVTTTQLDCKNKWSDNSCKHGIISVIAPAILASASHAVTLARAAPSGSSVDLSTLPGSGYTLSTALTVKALQGTTDGTTYNVNWMTELTSALGGATCSYWRQGAVVSECRINKDLEGSLHLQADIARYSDGSVQVDMIALNDYYNPASGIGHRRYYYTVTQNGTAVVDYSSGVGVAQSLYTTRHDMIWSNGAPGHVVQYDTQYLIDAGFVLNFNKTLDPDTVSGYSESTLATAMADTARWGGRFPYAYLDPDFTAGGGSPPEIGYYTGPQFTLMMAWKKTRYDYVLGQADASGSIPWHQFDKTLGRYADSLDHPTAWYDTRDTSVFTNWGCEQQPATLTTTASTASGNNVLHFGAGNIPGSATNGPNIYIGADWVQDWGGASGLPSSADGPGLLTVTAINTTTGDVTISQNVTSTINIGAQVRFSCRWRPNGLHPPNLTSLPYMVTGERYYYDEMLAETNWTQVGLWPPQRNGNGGPATTNVDIILNFTTNVRQQAWNYRQLNESLFLTPDDSYYSWYKTNLPTMTLDNANYANSAIDNIKTLVGSVVYGWVGGGNGWGYANAVPTDGTCTGPGAPYSYVTPPWQHAYMVASVGHAIKHKINVTENTLLLQNLGNFLTGMAQTHTGWDRRNAGAYYMSVCNFTTSVFAKDWETISTDMVGHSPCTGNDCNFASTGFVSADYMWLGAESNGMISNVLGVTTPGPTGLDGYTYLRDALIAAGQDINAEPQWVYRP